MSAFKVLSTFIDTVPYILSAATFELKMYGTVTINVPDKQGFGVYQKIFRPVTCSIMAIVPVPVNLEAV